MLDDDILTNSRIMVESRVIRGSSIVAPRKTAKPRRYDSVRMCSQEDCDTELSAYNKGPYCYYHAPFKQPRIRGRQYVR